MIIRISGDGQYRVDRSVLDPLNAIDDLLEDALQARDQKRFRRELDRLLALVRDGVSAWTPITSPRPSSSSRPGTSPQRSSCSRCPATASSPADHAR